MTGTRKPYEGPEPYIFVSYARKDGGKVYPLLDALCGAGYRIWYDENIPWSAEWADIIAKHIADCAVVLAFHSEASKDSRNCKEEVYYTLRRKKDLVSVYVDDVQFEYGLEMRLSPYQFVRLSQFADAAAFVERMNREPVFKDCRTSAPAIPWNRDGNIQWYLDGNGVLTIAKNSHISGSTAPMPDYGWDFEKQRTTAPWWDDREKIVSVVIEDSVTSIGVDAFYGCTSLTDVRIPDSVTYIGFGAFYRCTSLTDVRIPDSVTYIGLWAFRNCSNLKRVEIPVTMNVGWLAFDERYTEVIRREPRIL